MDNLLQCVQCYRDVEMLYQPKSRTKRSIEKSFARKARELFDKYLFVKKIDAEKNLHQMYNEVMLDELDPTKEAKFRSGQTFDYRVSVCNQNVSCGVVESFHKLKVIMVSE